MIIRSGLIERRGEIDAGRFSEHWRNVHGPLAAVLPNLKGYAQNLVLVRRQDFVANDLHPVDGISQLWFDDVGSMETGMKSPENDACVVDITGFLANVTLAVQQIGSWQGTVVEKLASKVMAIHVGDIETEKLAEFISARLSAAGDSACRWRINPVVSRGFIVDPSVPRSREHVACVFEAWFSDHQVGARMLSNEFWGGGDFRPAMAAIVQEHVVVLPPADQEISY